MAKSSPAALSPTQLQSTPSHLRLPARYPGKPRPTTLLSRLGCRFKHASRASSTSFRKAALCHAQTVGLLGHYYIAHSLHTAVEAWNELSQRQSGDLPFATRSHGSRTPRVGAARERTWAWRGPRPVAKAGCVVWVCLFPPSFM
jgi:hypothetical protein